jgi:signal transduction histidine kinase
MTQARSSRREILLIQIVAYVLLFATAGMGILRAESSFDRWLSAGVILTMAVAMARMPRPGAPAWAPHLYLAVQGALATVLMYFHIDWNVFTLLFFILSPQAVMILPSRQAMVWVGLYALITAAFCIGRWGISGGLVTGIVYTAGYSFLGVLVYALQQADAARQESQRLLEELQEAHETLRTYAIRVEELAVVEERSRVAREMHDTIGHRLTVAAVQLEGAQRLIPQAPDRAVDLVATVREQVREALAELRSTVAALRKPIEADLRLRSALQRLLAHFEAATGLPVQRILPDQMPPLPEAHRLALFRAAQEALTNIQRHAQASQVWLVLTVHDAAVTLLVSDDGRGVTLGGGQPGFGLRGLRERAAQLGGEVHVDPRRGGGTQLSFRLPLPAVVEPEASAVGPPMDTAAPAINTE